MITANRASSTPVSRLFNWPDNQVITKILDYELGGVALNDSSQGLMVQKWTFMYRDSTVYAVDSNGVEHAIFGRDRITELSGTFDQNMRPTITYIVNDEMHLNWYDTSINARRDDNFGPALSPRVAMDDKRPTQFANSDIILGYIRDGTLYYRQQRDRYTIERALKSGLFPVTRLKNIGMDVGWRLRFELV